MVEIIHPNSSFHQNFIYICICISCFHFFLLFYSFPYKYSHFPFPSSIPSFSPFRSHLLAFATERDWAWKRRVGRRFPHLALPLSFSSSFSSLPKVRFPLDLVFFRSLILLFIQISICFSCHFLFFFFSLSLLWASICNLCFGFRWSSDFSLPSSSSILFLNSGCV